MAGEMVAFFEVTLATSMAIGLGSLGIGLYYEFVVNKRKSRYLSSSANSDLVRNQKTK